MHIVHEKSIGTKMNDLDDLCLEVLSRSRQPLRYIKLTLNSRKPLESRHRGLVPKDRKWHGLSDRHVTDDFT